MRDVFAYDGEGRLVPVVQLYDQDGRPLDLLDDGRLEPGADGGTVQALPVTNADGRQLWNVYPVRRAVVPEVFTVEDGATIPPTPTPVAPAPPFRSVAPVPSASPTPTPTTSPTATRSPTATASPSPTTSPTTSPSPTR